MSGKRLSSKDPPQIPAIAEICGVALHPMDKILVHLLLSVQLF